MQNKNFKASRVQERLLLIILLIFQLCIVFDLTFIILQYISQYINFFLNKNNIFLVRGLNST